MVCIYSITTWILSLFISTYLNISLLCTEREILHLKWKKAVERSLGWEVDPIEEPTEGMLKKIYV